MERARGVRLKDVISKLRLIEFSYIDSALA